MFSFTMSNYFGMGAIQIFWSIAPVSFSSDNNIFNNKATFKEYHGYTWSCKYVNFLN